MNRRLLLLLLLSAAALAVLAQPAIARRPAGNWTFVRKDLFHHYACKAVDRSNGGRWQIRTATFLNGHDDARGYGIGVYAALSRGRGRTVASRTVTNWRGSYIRLTLHGARSGDRLWMQGSYYGPPRPWADGKPISSLTHCARRTVKAKLKRR